MNFELKNTVRELGVTISLCNWCNCLENVSHIAKAYNFHRGEKRKIKAWFGFHIHNLETTVTSVLWVWSSISNVEVSKANKKKKSIENNHVQFLLQ